MNLKVNAHIRSHLSHTLRARPHGMGYQYSTPIKWETTTTMNRKYECLLADAKV